MKQPFHPLPLDDCHLKKTRLDLWLYPLNMVFPEAFSLLNHEEKTRATRYHFKQHQQRFTLARALLRLILARYVQSDPQTLSWSENRYGKPHLDPASSLHFNLSHSRDLALLAVGQHHPVGVDLEFFSARPFQGIATQLFSPTEQQALQHTPACLTPLAFYSLWAQKEAFIKACGLGLSYPTRSFNVPAFPYESSLVMDTREQTLWKMQSFMPRIGCCAALCHHPDITEIRYLELTSPP